MNDKLSPLTIILVATANITTIISHPAIADTITASKTDYIFLVTPDWHNCQQIGAAYQEVYAFETPNFYVNICQNGDRFFYSGEAKQGNINSMFLPAYPLKNGRGYQADNGNISYLVLVPNPTKINSQGTEKLLAVKRNGKTILVESALKPANSCPQLNHPLALNSPENINYDLNRTNTVIKGVTPESGLNLPSTIFNLDSRFNFYNVNGELQQLNSCR
ncbi:MAG: hypothetical protein Tsb0014_33910 [Pleurocapsa sp.]